MTQQKCRLRLLHIANIEGDADLLQNDTEGVYTNYIRNLIRFFAQDPSIGFAENMHHVAHSLCIQSEENCFLISTCELIDLKRQRDELLKDGADLSSTKMLKRLDKGQIARLTMSSTVLFNYVVNDNGASVLDIIARFFDVEHAGYMVDTFEQKAGGLGNIWTKVIADNFEDILLHILNKNGPVWMSFRPGRLGHGGLEGGNKIPCFNSFDRAPAEYLFFCWLMKLRTKAS